MLGHDPLSSRPLSDVEAGSAAATDVTRGPVVIRREVRHWPIPPQSVNLLVTTLAPVVAAPFVPVAWPVPRGYSRVQYGYVQASLREESAAPFVPTVAENPRGTAFAVSLRTWLQSLVTTTLTPSDAAPFAPIAFPNPVTRRTGVDGLTWAQSPAVPAVENPRAQSTTPNPVLRAKGVDGLTWTQSPQPTPNDDTTVLRSPVVSPRIPAPLRPGFTQSTPVTLFSAPALPQVQSAFDLPVRRKWDANLYTWTQSPQPPAESVSTATLRPPLYAPRIVRKQPDGSFWQAPITLQVTAAPFVQSTTQNPVLRRIGALTWTQSPAVPEADTTTFPAFAGWVNPVLRRTDINGRTWIQSPAVPDSPFVQANWPNPILRKERFDLRTWLQSLSLPANVDQGKPFAQSDWPNPVRVPRNVAQSGMVLAPYPEGIPPAPPPAPDTSATGGWWRPVYKRRRRDVPVEVTAPAIEAVREAVAVVAAAPAAPTKAQRQAVKAAEALFAEEMRQQWKGAYAYELRQLWAEELQRALAEQQRAEDDEIAALLLLSA